MNVPVGEALLAGLKLMAGLMVKVYELPALVPAASLTLTKTVLAPPVVGVPVMETVLPFTVARRAEKVTARVPSLSPLRASMWWVVNSKSKTSKLPAIRSGLPERGITTLPS